MFHRDDMFEGGGLLYDATFSPDGRRLAATWSVWNDSQPEQKHWEHRLEIWDLETGQKRLRRDVPLPTKLAFSPDGRRLSGGMSSSWASPGHESELLVWDAETGETILSRKFAQGLVADVTYNGAGTLLAVAVGNVGDAGVIHLLDAASGQTRRTFAGHRAMIAELAFCPDGRRLASLASFPMQVAEVKLWDLAGRPGDVDPEDGRGGPRRQQRHGEQRFCLQPRWSSPLLPSRRLASRGPCAGLGCDADHVRGIADRHAFVGRSVIPVR